MNYRDLQNISNLSQQILVEGANEEHNVLNRWPYTSPYLQESTELDEGEKPLPYGRMMKKSDELASTDDKTKQKRAAKIYTAANAPKGPKIKVKEQVDIYDIILSHLLDEGYAETQEQAEVIMVNMSEDWKNSILS
jgi:hypothetical protein